MKIGMLGHTVVLSIYRLCRRCIEYAIIYTLHGLGFSCRLTIPRMSVSWGGGIFLNNIVRGLEKGCQLDQPAVHEQAVCRGEGRGVEMPHGVGQVDYL